MKYLKKFEKYNNKLINDYHLVLYKLVNYVFEENNFYIRNKIDTDTIRFTYNSSLFLSSHIMEYAEEYDSDRVDIRIDEYYIDIDIWKITKEFKEYFCSIIEPLSYSYDKDVDYSLRKDKVKKLIELLSVENYKIHQDANKYNL